MDKTLFQNNSELLIKLIKTSIPADKADSYLAYTQRILSSKISYTTPQSIPQTLSQLKRRLSAPDFTRASKLITLLESKPTLKNFPELLALLSKLMDHKLNSIPSLPISTDSKPLQPSQQPSAPELKSYPRVSVESFLIKDILYAFQGIEGKYLNYSRLDDRFSIRKEIPDSLKSLAENLAELGWLFKRVDGFIRNNEEFPSIICQSFCACLKSELKEFYRFIALLETQVNSKLKEIELWCDEPLERIRWLAIVCEAVEGLKGGNFISAIFSYSKYGNPAVKVLVNRVLDSVSLPLIEMIQSWMLDGELCDTFHEFFVEEDLEVSENQLWLRKYKLIKELVPGFFTPELVDLIFLTGKSINFLRKCCLEEWKSEAPIELPKLRDLLDMKLWAERAATATNMKLIGILFTKYRLLDHLKCMRRYLLLAQGDFHHYLMEQLNNILNEPAKKIHKHHLVSILENAIRVSNAQNDDMDLLSKLSIRLEDFTTLDNGWDVFILKYQIDSPLNSIFSDQVMSQYTRIFKLFWRIKRLYFYMNSYQDGSLMIKLQEMRDLRYILHKSQMLRLEIMHFINNLYHYLMVEVQEGVWNGFFQHIEKSEDLDKLIKAHSEFLEAITERAFLNPENERVLKRLLKILELGLRFKLSQETLITSAIDELARRSNLKISESNVNSGLRGLSVISVESINDIERLYNDFHEDIQTFRKCLGDNDSAHLKFLSFRLDFNEFYTSSMPKEC